MAVDSSASIGRSNGLTANSVLVYGKLAASRQYYDEPLARKIQQPLAGLLPGYDLAPDSCFDIIAIRIEDIGGVVSMAAIFRRSVVLSSVRQRQGMKFVYRLAVGSLESEMERTKHGRRKGRAVIIALRRAYPEKWKFRSSGEDGRVKLGLALSDGDSQRRKAALVKGDASLRVRGKYADVIKHELA